MSGDAWFLIAYFGVFGLLVIYKIHERMKERKEEGDKYKDIEN